MSLLSSWDYMDVPVKLLVDYIWATEDDKQVSWMLDWIVTVNYICKYGQYPWPSCKLVLKQNIYINKDKWDSWTNEKWRSKSWKMSNI